MKTIFCLAACLAALSASANGVTDWSAVTERFATEKRPSGSSEVLIGLVHAAMHDAVAASEGGLRPILATGMAPNGGSPDVAAAVAAHGVLKARLPAQGAALDAELERWMAAHAGDADAGAGAEAGRQVARAVIEVRANDGLDAKAEWKAQERAAGRWEPTAPTAPLDLTLGRVPPIGAVDLARHRPSAPELEGEVRSRDLIEVRTLGRKESTARTAQQTETAMFWSDHTATQYSRAVRGLALERGLDTRESARMLAMVHVATANALIACFDTKYQYTAWRPVHAIRAATPAGEAPWDSLLNVNHPEFPSGHSCFTGAVTEGLARYFGTRKVAITITSTPIKATRRYEDVDAVVADVTEARILSGLHFRQSMLAGTKLGADIAAEVVARNF
jgi:hypothetical protein